MIIKGNYSKKLPMNRISIKQTSSRNTKNDILYALISIYYYEQTLSLNNNKELIFSENKTYYFINPNWIIHFKKVYNYQMLSQILKPFKINNIPITYYNFEKNISSIKDYLSQNNFALKNDELEKNLMNNISAIQKKSNNLVYCPFCYIIDMKIKNIIQNYVFTGNRLNIYGQKVFAKNNYIYLNISNNIMSGNLNRNFIFISEYVLCFSSPEFLLNEKSFLLKSSFSDYLKYKNIDRFTLGKLPLKDENNNIIGEIMLILKNQTNNENKKLIPTNDNSREKIILKKEKEINNKGNELIKKDKNLIEKENNNNKENELIKKDKNLIEKENNLNEREKIISNKEKEINKKENELIKTNNAINEKEKNIKEREKKISNKEKEIINKENKLDKINKNLIEKENNLNEREKIISNKEKEINNKENELNKKNNELIEKEDNLNKREKMILQKENELIIIKNNLNEREEEINNKLKKNEDLLQSNKEPLKENIPIPIIPIEPDPISSYIKPTLIGLNDIEAAYFMNSTLQCLSQTPNLTNYFLKDSKRGRIINNNLAKENKNSLQLSPI